MKRLSHRPRSALHAPQTAESNPAPQGSNSLELPVLRVREIVRIPKLTPLGQVAALFAGEMKFRGKIIPVLDMRAHGPGRSKEALRACVMIVQVHWGDKSPLDIGIAVDTPEHGGG